MNRAVYFVSCSTGITAETLGHSLLTQFEGVEFDHFTLPFVNTPDKANRVIGMINKSAVDSGMKPLVFCTLVDSDIRKHLIQSDGIFFDFFDTFIAPLETELKMPSSHTVGRSHGVANYARYMSRIDAVNYALVNDDGMVTKNYGQADVILVGVSRVGKTPTCLYLAMQFGVRAANYPLTEEDLESVDLPEDLLDHQDRLFALTINADRLQEIRNERRPDSPYSSAQQCSYELRKADAMFESYQITCLNTSTTSIEEISTTILQTAGIARRIY